MSVIAIANAKGGVGKTTLALVIAQVLVRRGARVTLLEADPNRPLASWFAMRARAPAFTLESGIDESTVLGAIGTASSGGDHVVVDLEGTANVTTVFAVSRADLVLVPMQGSQLDADQALRVLRQIRDQQELVGRPIPTRIVFTRTSAIEGRDFRHIRAELAAARIPVMATQLTDRAAFRAMIQTGDGLYDLSAGDVHNPAAAVENGEAITDEIMSILQQEADRETQVAVNG